MGNLSVLTLVILCLASSYADPEPSRCGNPKTPCTTTADCTGLGPRHVCLGNPGNTYCRACQCEDPTHCRFIGNTVVCPSCETPRELRTAFTAYQGSKVTYSPGQIMIFDRIVYNNNDGYDSTTGIFTAKTDGTYMFSFSIEFWAINEFVVYLKVDNIIKSAAILDTNSGSTMSTNMAVLGLTEGQSVWIEAARSGQLWGEDMFGATSFTGSFLYN